MEEEIITVVDFEAVDEVLVLVSEVEEEIQDSLTPETGIIGIETIILIGITIMETIILGIIIMVRGIGII